MKNHRRNEIKVGLTVLIGLLVLFYGIAVFKNWGFGKPEYVLTIRFPTSAGLQVGDEVTVSGVKAGRVESVILDGGSVLVRSVLGNEFPVMSDAVATIQMLELMGGKKIDINPGSSGAPFDHQTVMSGKVDPDIAGALALVGGLEGDMKQLTGKADRLLDNVNVVIGDREFVGSLKEAVENLRVISADVRLLVAANKSNATTLADNVVRLTNRVDTLLTESRPYINSSLRKGDKVLTGADTLLTEVTALVKEIRESRGLLNKVLHDEALTKRLDAMLVKVDSLTSIIINGEFVTRIKLF